MCRTIWVWILTTSTVANLPLAAGMVITVEPGLYLEDGGIGIRIEDDVLVSETGAVNLSEKLPHTTEEIETFMNNGGINNGQTST